MAELRFDDRVAVVTGGGRGLGRAHAMLLAARGAKVVVNDPGVSMSGDATDEGPADELVREIRAAGGEAVANTDSVATPEGGKAIIETALGSKGYECMYDPIGSTLVAFAADRALVASGGRVAILTAGSSDRPAAAQAGTMLIEMGCEVRTYHDMGVAGLHRLVRPLRDALSFDPDALIVAAGMDGVLPGVVAGLVALPIVALPTSTGYGFGGDGIGAMTTMMQACAPGVAVVNIDNGIGAGIMAGLIANRAAAQRSGAS